MHRVSRLFRNGYAVAALLFAAIVIFDQYASFGYLSKGQAPDAKFTHASWVFARHVVGWTLFIASGALVLGRFARPLYALAFCYSVIVESACYFVKETFHADLQDILVPVLLNTNAGEVSNFIAMFSSFKNIAYLLGTIAAMAAGCVLIWRAEYKRPDLKRLALACASIVAFFGLCCLPMQIWHAGLATVRITGTIGGLFQSWRDVRGVFAASRNEALPEKVATLVDKASLPCGIIVVGESITRNDMSAYGYSRATTPLLDTECKSGECILYSDVLGLYSDTSRALSVFLSDIVSDDLSRGSWTMPEVFRRAGYRTVLIANQPAPETSTIYKLFNGCEKRIYLMDECGGPQYDGATVDFAKRELEAGDGRPVVVFVHLNGAHYPVWNVNPKEYDFFGKMPADAAVAGLDDTMRDRVDRYDNAVLYQDKVWSDLRSVAKDTGKEAFLFFMSDHGESPREKEWRRFDSLDVYELPVFFWFSEKYAARHPDIVERVCGRSATKLQPEEMTTGILELGLIDLKSATCFPKSFLDADFKGRNPRKYYMGRRVYEKDL